MFYGISIHRLHSEKWYFNFVGHTLRLYYIYNANKTLKTKKKICTICYGCVSLIAVTILQWNWSAEHSAGLTIKPVDTHHKVNTIIKLLIVLLRGEVGQIWRQERKVAVQAGLKAQLFEQLLFGFVETGEKGEITCDYSNKLKSNISLMCTDKQIMYNLNYRHRDDDLRFCFTTRKMCIS